MFLPNAYVFTVANPDRHDIVQLLPGAGDVPKGSIWDLDNPDLRVVRAKNNLTTMQGLRQWHALTPGRAWLGRILVVNHPSAVPIRNADLLHVNIGDVVTLLGAPFWMGHNTDLLEGSFVVPATTYGPGITAEESEYTHPLLGLVQVSRLLPPGSLDPSTLN